MTTNPLKNGTVQRGGVAQLHDHVTQFNNYRWVVGSGKLYYVASRTRVDGTIEHFVDRHL